MRCNHLLYNDCIWQAETEIYQAQAAPSVSVVDGIAILERTLLEHFERMLSINYKYYKYNKLIVTS